MESLYSFIKKILKRKLFLYFRKWYDAFFIPNQEIKKNNPEKMFYIPGNGIPGKIYFIFLKEILSHIPGSGNLEKIPYASGNRTFLYVGKDAFRTLVYSEIETYSKHCKTSTMEPFSFNIKQFLIFSK